MLYYWGGIMSLISNTVDRIYMYDNLHLALSLLNIMDFVHVSMFHLRFLECRKNSTATSIIGSSLFWKFTFINQSFIHTFLPFSAQTVRQTMVPNFLIITTIGYFSTCFPILLGVRTCFNNFFARKFLIWKIKQSW